MTTFDRREAIRRLAVGGAAVVGAPFWVEALAGAAAEHAARYQSQAAAAGWTPKVFTPAQNELVIALTERIIPETDTPGAAKAGVNQFIDAVLADASPEVRRQFLDGLAWVDARSRRDHGVPFVQATEAQQNALLTAISSREPADDDRAGADFFRALKPLTVTGYYTSEAGLLEEIGEARHLFFPEFKGCTHPEHS
ncbi:MAG TPA: gluconate 2-dehydrogenase subunit 3 family protein [Vicinamibacterales bacterium]